ncbi:hypothetical protein SCLCIDRAFT_248355 [Scleroderma citrinum Foug A]|uniref:Uncharacterized protein n=1 Tax=Scleroderma citrinum Foug A TaxID=1036808 RepID=A0A0C3D6B8_9AGAM|nr:hypothetical protein SCLCIDRAFT_248355 [Scleroderma citrinum Foug A]
MEKSEQLNCQLYNQVMLLNKPRPGLYFFRLFSAGKKLQPEALLGPLELPWASEACGQEGMKIFLPALALPDAIRFVIVKFEPAHLTGTSVLWK